MPLLQLENKDIPKYRLQILKEQNNLCALCGVEITEKTGVSLDHQHRTKSSVIGEDGGGLVRGVLCRKCNVFEGKIWNNSKRFGITNLSDWLRVLADYLDKENYPLIHPSEKQKEPTVSKRKYNSLKKQYNLINKNKKKFPEYPKSKKLTKPLAKLFKDFSINPYN